jgi:hypothetical protein
MSSVLSGNVLVEGYWAQSRHDTSRYPWPKSSTVTENPEWFHMRSEFCEHLLQVQEQHTHNALCYMGLSPCRLCTKPTVVGYREYVLYGVEYDGKIFDLHWPEGLHHYLTEHDVVPSKLFISVINSL